MTKIRMKAPEGSTGISQGRNRAEVGEDGHAMVPIELVDDAISHGFVVAHLAAGADEQPISSSPAAPEQPAPETRAPLMKPAMPGDGAGKGGAFDLPLRKAVTAPAEKPAPKPRKAEGNGRRQK